MLAEENKIELLEYLLSVNTVDLSKVFLNFHLKFNILKLSIATQGVGKLSSSYPDTIAVLVIHGFPKEKVINRFYLLLFYQLVDQIPESVKAAVERAISRRSVQPIKSARKN